MASKVEAKTTSMMREGPDKSLASHLTSIALLAPLPLGDCFMSLPHPSSLSSIKSRALALLTRWKKTLLQQSRCCPTNEVSELVAYLEGCQMKTRPHRLPPFNMLHRTAEDSKKSYPLFNNSVSIDVFFGRWVQKIMLPT